MKTRDTKWPPSSTPAELLAFQTPPRPCCVILDIGFNDTCNGLEVHARMKHLNWRAATLFIITHWDVSTVVKAVRAGVEEFLPTKPFDPSKLLEAVAKSIEVSKQKLAQLDQSEDLRVRAAVLSAREREIVRLVASGLLNKEIADHLGLAVITVKVHRDRAMQKLGAGNSAEL